MNEFMIRRQRLLGDLDDRDLPLVVLAAPSGYGKTTLVRTWADQAERRILWVPFVRDHATVADIGQTIILAAHRAGLLDDRALAEAASELDVTDDPIPALVRALGAHSVGLTLVLDGYERAQGVGDAAEEAILAFLESSPDSRVVVTAWSAPRLSAPATQMRVNARVLGADDLAFTEEETAELIGLRLPDALAQVHAIQEATRGYPLALSAVVLGESTPALADDPEGWRLLVAQDIQRKVPALLRSFLAITSVAPYFDGALAARLSGRADAVALLDVLERRGLGRWFPYSPGRRMFQYVDSIRAALVEELRSQQPEEYAKACGAVARWLSSEGDQVIALRLAIDAGDLALASAAYRTLIVERPEIYITNAVHEDIARIPIGELRSYPILAFARGLAELSAPSTQGAATEYLEIVAERILSGVKELSPAHVAVLIGVKVAALRLLGRFEESGSAARASLRYLDAYLADDEREPALVGLRPLLFRDLAYSLFQAGDAVAAHSLITRAVGLAQRPVSRNYALAHATGLSAILGRRYSAIETAASIDPDAWPRGHELSYLNALGKVGEAVLCLDRSDYTGALAAYEGCESFLSTAEIWPFAAWTEALARLGLGEFTAEAHRLQELLASNPAPPGIGANLGTAMLRGSLATLWLAAGRRSRAQELLESADPCAGQLAPARALFELTDDPHRVIDALPHLTDAPGHSVRSRLALLTFGAAAGRRIGNRSLALSLLDQASGLHQAHGARAHLITLPDEDLGALRELALGHDKRSAVEYLGTEDPISAMPTRAPSPVLTEREVLVLRTLAEEPARKKVAARLFVSENTVKTQMANIYRKLGVTSRGAALQRAVELELLDIEATLRV